MRRALMLPAPPPSRPTLYAAPVVQVTEIVEVWSMFATSGPCVPKSSIVGAVVEMLHAFWIVMRTGIVFVTVAEKTLVDARPNVTRTAVAIALMLISVSPLGLGCGFPLKWRAHRGPFDIARFAGTGDRATG